MISLGLVVQLALSHIVSSMLVTKAFKVNDNALKYIHHTIRMCSSVSSNTDKVINLRNVVPFSMTHKPSAFIYRSACATKASKIDVSLYVLLFSKIF